MSEKMMAAVLCGDRDLQYKETEKPTPKAGEVLVRVRASGICGSDIPRIFVNGTYHFPTIPGHEFSGEVVGVGDDKNKELIIENINKIDNPSRKRRIFFEKYYIFVKSYPE